MEVSKHILKYNIYMNTKMDKVLKIFLALLTFTIALKIKCMLLVKIKKKKQQNNQFSLLTKIKEIKQLILNECF